MRPSGPVGKSHLTRSPSRKLTRDPLAAARLSLKRLPGDFSWKLLSRLFECCSCELSVDDQSEFRSVLRSRNIDSYRTLSARWVLQCRTAQKDNFESNGFAIALKYQLAQLLLKNLDCPSVPAKERSRNCIQAVIQLDTELQSRILGDLGDPVFRETKRIIEAILSDAPDSTEIQEYCKHGPGSTATIPYANRSSYFKYAEWPYSCSRGAEALFKQCVSSDERWLGSLEQSYRERHGIKAWQVLNWDQFWSSVITRCEYNVITSVPKDGAKNRPIAKEPTANVYLQLGVGALIKGRLLKAGLDLRSQLTNRSLARLASLQSHNVLMPCTFDLSNASDTIHRDLVKELLPRGWFELLDSIRSPYGLLPDGTGWRYAKMSSMGNATTFELESLIFFSLLRAVVRVYGDYSDVAYTNVYGDDLIFPKYLARIVQRYLTWFGFSVNASKSFSSGGFYESCGSDWLWGTDIRPVFVKGDPVNVPEMFSIRNRLNRWFANTYGTLMPDELDTFFLSWIEGDHRQYLGPESDTEFDTYWHTHLGSRTDVRFMSYSARQSSLTEGDIWFRKLMHNLRSCNSDGGSRFEIQGEGGWRVGPRVLHVRDFYRDARGLPQDHIRPTFAVMRAPTVRP